MDMRVIKDYFSTDEAKIAFGVWSGGFVSEFIARTIYNAIFKPKTQAEQGNSKAKSLIISILTKGFVGTLLYAMGKENIFLRYMAIGSMVSIFNDIMGYFLPAPTAVAEKASAYVANLKPGVVVQTV